MKKLKLKALTLGATEVLTRAQLKNVLGGDGSGGGTGYYFCECEDGRSSTIYVVDGQIASVVEAAFCSPVHVAYCIRTS